MPGLFSAAEICTTQFFLCDTPFPKKLIKVLCFYSADRNYFLIRTFCIDKPETASDALSGMNDPNEGMRLEANKYGNISDSHSRLTLSRCVIPFDSNADS